MFFSVINTTHNVSQKLCHAAADVLRHVSRVPGLEEDADTSLTLETVTYLLEDTNMLQTSSRNKMSTELAGDKMNKPNRKSKLKPQCFRNIEEFEETGAGF